MPGDTRTLTIKWVGDASSVEKSAGKASGALGKIGTIAGGVFTGQALTQGAEKVVGFLEDSTKAAMSDQESQALLARQMQNTTGAHKEQIDSVEKLIGRLSDATGVTRDELRPAYAALLRGTHDVTKANGALKLAMDISAGSGKPLTAVSLALSKAYNGNVTGLTRLGIKVKGLVPDTHALASAQEAQQSALVNLADAIKKHGANSTEAQKAQDKYKLATQRVSDAQSKQKSVTLSTNAIMKQLNKTFGGEAAAAADTSAGKMRRLHEQFHETQVEIGTKLLPVLIVVEDFLLNTLPQAIEVAVKWFQVEWPKIYAAIGPLVLFVKRTVSAVTEIIKGLILFFQGFIQFIRGVFTGQWGSAWKGIEKMFSGIIAIISGYFKAMWTYFQQITLTAGKLLLGAFIAVFTAVANWVNNSIQTMISRTVADFLSLGAKIAGAIWSGIGAAISAAASFGSQVGGAIYNGVKSALTGLVNVLTGVVKGALNAVISVFNRLDPHIHIPAIGIGPFKTPGVDADLFPHIPMLAEGGITTGAGLAYLHPLEAVMPLRNSGLGGNTYNVNVAVGPGGDPSAVGRAVVNAIRTYERHNGTSWRATS